MKHKLFALLACLSILFSCGQTAYAEGAYTVAQVQNLSDGIVAYKERQNGVGSVQALIDGFLTENAGTTAEFYVLAFSQSGRYRWDSYERALLSYLQNNRVSSASSRLKYALTLAAVGSSDRYIADTADEAIGGLGVMSLVFGLHLLNNGYSSSSYSTDGLVTELLAAQKSDGGWAVMGSYGDVDVTAMTLQALAPHYGSRGDVRTAVHAGLELLSRRQLASGGFMTMGAENSESAAQVVIALSALGIDAQNDDRFIKNGNSALSALLQYRCDDGSFAHTTASNETATVEVLCALTAYLRMSRGQGSLYLLDRAGDPGSTEGKTQSGGNRDKSTGAGRTLSKEQENNGSDLSGGSASDRQDPVEQSGSAGSDTVSVNGRQFILSTDAAGEPVTVPVTEKATEAAQRPTYGGFQPSATGDEKRPATFDEGGAQSGPGYKLYVIIGIVGAAGVACAVLFLLKKRGKKHFLSVAVIAAAGVLFVLLTNFESPESYRQSVPEKGDLSVTLSIRCDTIADREKVNRYIPDDGVILDDSVMTVSEGATVYDVLLQAVREYGIPMDNRGADGAAYIAGLNYLYEFDYGDLSGWMYRVNGRFPDVGCQSCSVADGDRIEWLYTTDIGKDLE